MTWVWLGLSLHYECWAHLRTHFLNGFCVTLCLLIHREMASTACLQLGVEGRPFMITSSNSHPQTTRAFDHLLPPSSNWDPKLHLRSLHGSSSFLGKSLWNQQTPSSASQQGLQPRRSATRIWDPRLTLPSRQYVHRHSLFSSMKLYCQGVRRQYNFPSLINDLIPLPTSFFTFKCQWF